jgi:hypothetical protein
MFMPHTKRAYAIKTFFTAALRVFVEASVFSSTPDNRQAYPHRA